VGPKATQDALAKGTVLTPVGNRNRFSCLPPQSTVTVLTEALPLLWQACRLPLRYVSVIQTQNIVSSPYLSLLTTNVLFLVERVSVCMTSLRTKVHVPSAVGVRWGDKYDVAGSIILDGLLRCRSSWHYIK
jgi:hypothetical protein